MLELTRLEKEKKSHLLSPQKTMGEYFQRKRREKRNYGTRTSCTKKRDTKKKKKKK